MTSTSTEGVVPATGDTVAVLKVFRTLKCGFVKHFDIRKDKNCRIRLIIFKLNQTTPT